MKNILLVLILVVGASAHWFDGKSDYKVMKQLTKDFDNLEGYQKRNLLKIYKYASKNNMGWSAAAIAWQETNVGQYQVNFNSRKNGIQSFDCGMFGSNTRTVLKRAESKPNMYNQKEVCTDLIKDFEYAYSQFLAEIYFWKNARHNTENWRKIWGSYNAGWKYSKSYGRIIALRIKVLRANLDIKEGN